MDKALDALAIYAGTRDPRQRAALGPWAADIVAQHLTARERELFAGELARLRAGRLEPAAALKLARALRGTLPD